MEHNGIVENSKFYILRDLMNKLNFIQSKKDITIFVKDVNGDEIDSLWIIIDSERVEYHDTYGILSDNIDEIINLLNESLKNETINKNSNK